MSTPTLFLIFRAGFRYFYKSDRRRPTADGDFSLRGGLQSAVRRAEIYSANKKDPQAAMPSGGLLESQLKAKS
jgi:hypothetical protein